MDDRRLCVYIPQHLDTQLLDAIGVRAMHLFGERHPGKAVGAATARDVRSIGQARDEAVTEALEDWLAKEKSAKWVHKEGNT